MKLNITIKKSFSFSTQSLGELDCFPISVGDEQEIRERLGKSIEKSTAKEYVSSLISVACHRCVVGDEEHLKPPNPSLSLSDIADIQDEELDDFVKKYLEANDHLYKENISRLEPNKNGPGTVVSFEYGDVEHPRIENETYIAYLHRLSVIQEKRNSERLKKYAGFTGGFSNALKAQMEKTLNMGNALNDSFARVKAKEIYSMGPQIPKIDFAEIRRKDQEARLKPFQDLAQRLDLLVSSSTSAGEFLVEMNKTQTTIAKELKESGDNTTFFSKINLFIGGLVLLLAIGSLAVAIYTSMSGSESSNTLIQNIGKYANVIERTLQTSTDKTIEVSTDSTNAIRELIDQQKRILTELEAIRRKLESDKPSKGKVIGAPSPNSIEHKLKVQGRGEGGGR
jgi:hypothetical protein